MNDERRVMPAAEGPGPRRDRRGVVGIAMGVLLLAFGSDTVLAQTAQGPVLRLVVGFAPGGAVDRMARILAPGLARVTGRNVIVENVSGANSARAIARVVSSGPDGDTLLLGTSALAAPDNASAAAALRPVILASTAPMVLVVRASLPVRDVREFAAYLTTNTGTTYGSSGIGNPTHLSAADFVARLRVEAVHVPYNGSTAAFADLLAGRIDFVMTSANSTLGNHAAVRVLAVTTRERSRLPGLDRIPTIAETLLPDFDHGVWQAIFASSRVPDAAVATLNAQFREVLALESVRIAIAESGVEIVGGSPEDAGRAYRADAERLRDLRTP